MTPTPLLHLAATITSALLLAACAGFPGGNSPPRDDALFDHLRTGMTTDEVSRLLGRPDAATNFRNVQQVAWDYTYFDNFGYYSMYSVLFGPDGRVVGHVHQRLNDGGDHAS